MGVDGRDSIPCADVYESGLCKWRWSVFSQGGNVTRRIQSSIWGPHIQRSWPCHVARRLERCRTSHRSCPEGKGERDWKRERTGCSVRSSRCVGLSLSLKWGKGRAGDEVMIERLHCNRVLNIVPVSI